MTEKHVSEKLASLRDQIKKEGVDGFLIPRADEFQGEYVPPSANRLAWLTGFTGSAGAAAVLSKKAFVISDGRYTIQIKQQVDGKYFETGDSNDTSLEKWIGANAQSGARIGYDPRLHTPSQIAALEKNLKEKNIALVPVNVNLLDAVWHDRPAFPSGMAEIYPEEYAGRSAAEKREQIAQGLRESGAKAAVLTMPDSIAWLLNIRGSDVPHNPFVLSYAIVADNGDVDWFVDPAKIPAEMAAHLGNRVRVCKTKELEGALAALSGHTVQLDHTRASVWFKNTLERAGAKVADKKDPCIDLKACKTPAEQKAITQAHVRDGVAVVKFLKWLDDEAPKGKLTEIGVEKKLLEFRKAAGGLRDTSFDTIAGWAGNGAIVHYRATPETDKIIAPPGILLVDSGGQYLEGTTDITRTVAVGKPTAEMVENNTRVLRGHIAVARMRFPDGLTGEQLDIVARAPLWDVGRDYAHGTGHGVGAYLSVHEAGVGISFRANSKFKPGMLVSNEPGYYKESAYGIRIENLIFVREDGKSEAGKPMMRFETVTLAPIDRRLIDADMLTSDELSWLNDYHARVYKTLLPKLDAAEKKWLAQATAPISKSTAAPKKRWGIFSL